MKGEISIERINGCSSSQDTSITDDCTATISAKMPSPSSSSLLSITNSDQWEDVKEEFSASSIGVKETNNTCCLDDETVQFNLDFFESSSTCSPTNNSNLHHLYNNNNGLITTLKRHKAVVLSSPKTSSSKKHYYNHHHHHRRGCYKRSISSPSLVNCKGSLFVESSSSTFKFVNTCNRNNNNNNENDFSSSCTNTHTNTNTNTNNCIHTHHHNPKHSLITIENRDKKAHDSNHKIKSQAPLNLVLERLDYKLKKIEKLEKKSQQEEEEIKQRYHSVKKKFLRMLELGMITSQQKQNDSVPPSPEEDDSDLVLLNSILPKAKHNKKAILYLQSPEKFSHFLSRKALKYYYKLCQIARYGTPTCEFAATRISDNIFLGDIDDAFNEPVLKELGITHIVTCVKSLFPIYPEKGFDYLNLHLYDEEDQNITDVFQLSYEFIEKAISSGSSVLVHCMKGKSRSASVLISYLMKKNEWSYQTALEFVRSKRQFVKPNSGFESQLMQLERSILNSSKQYANDDDDEEDHSSSQPTSAHQQDDSSSFDYFNSGKVGLCF